MFTPPRTIQGVFLKGLLTDDLEAASNPALENGLKPEAPFPNHNWRWRLAFRRHQLKGAS